MVSTAPIGARRASGGRSGAGSTATRRMDRRKELVAKTFTWVYAAGALVSLLTWGLVHLRARGVTWPEIVFPLFNVPVSRSLVSAAVLLIVTRALIGRKRVGLVAVAAFQVMGLLIGVERLVELWLVGPDVPPVLRSGFPVRLLWLLDVAAIVPAAALLWLCWWARSAFPGRLRQGSWGTLFGTLLAGLLATTALLWGTALALRPGVPTGQWVRAVLLRSLGYVGPFDGPMLGNTAAWVPHLTSLLLAGTLILAVVLFMRSSRSPGRWTAAKELEVRRALARYGDDDSLGYFATRRDRSSAFSPDGRAAVSYDIVAGVSLAAGDPVGDPASWPAAIETWKREAREYGWIPAVLAAGEDATRAYVDAGFGAIPLGDEAILEPATFRLNNTSMNEVRRAVQHARRSGLHVSVRRQSDVPAEELDRLVALADEWREGTVERGFSMALDRRGDPADGRMLVVLASDAEGAPVGLLTFVPWGSRGVSLDTMRRHPQAPNGTVDLMVAELMAQGPEFGVRRVSLNFAFLRGVFADAERLGAGTLTRFNSSVLGVFDRFFQLERLYRANQKYEPRWETRYLCLDTRLSIPQVAIACGMAEGFLPRPGRRGRRVPVSQATLGPDELEQVREIERTPVVSAADLAPRRGDQTRVRLDHLARLRDAGDDPYAVGVAPATRLAELDVTPDGRVSAPAADDARRFHGRVRTIRDHGGVAFVRLVDGHAQTQLVLQRDVLGADRLRRFVRDVDSGDLLVVDAYPTVTRNGTPSWEVTGWQVAAKALHPIPFDVFNDPETRLRRRSDDLLVHPREADQLRLRSHVVRSVRDTLQRAGYLEVETPILHTVHGGASARPFTTFSNAYGVDLSLRIAPELYLKRLVVAGMGPVFEIGRNFRNEGADATHNPEFTALEAYEPFGDYTTMRLLTERIVKDAATAVFGRPVLPLRTTPGAEPELVDVSEPWPCVSVLDAVSDAVGVRVGLDTDFETLLRLAREHDIAVRPEMGAGAIVEELYGELVEPVTVRPTFYVDFPVETSPLTGAHRSVPGLAERWDLVVGGMELGTAYSELTDPLEQRRRLTEQSLKAAAGDVEAMEVDEDFLRALESGMPPCGGLGIGVDRLVMLMADTSIRGVLTFPFVRPRA